jgi:hypothetical protein
MRHGRLAWCQALYCFQLLMGWWVDPASGFPIRVSGVGIFWLRLAKFNNDTRRTTSSSGLPRRPARW